MAKPKKEKVKKKRSEKYEKPYVVNATMDEFFKIVVTPKEELKEEDFKKDEKKSE